MMSQTFLRNRDILLLCAKSRYSPPLVICYSTSSKDGWKTYYEVLGVDRQASKKEIRAAYLKLTKQHHPDMKKSKDSDMFHQIKEAYEVLSDSEKRFKYDHNQLRRSDPDLPAYNHPTAKYYHDGTYFRGSKERIQTGFSNAQVAMMAFAFGFIGGLIQLFLVRRAHKTSDQSADEIHQSALEQIARIRLLRSHGGTEIQKQLAARRASKENRTDDSDLVQEIVDGAQTVKE